MAQRVFMDGAGTAWEVWATIPSMPRIVSDEMATGWLTFQSSAAHRRLAPIPAEWEALPEDALEHLCTRAAPVKRMRTTSLISRLAER